MEQKKLLLVLVSVGVFLVIVLGAGILVFKPRAKPIAPASAVTAPGQNVPGSAPASADPAEWVRNPKAVPGLQPQTPGTSSTRGDVIIIYGERGPGAAGQNGPAPIAGQTEQNPDGSLKVDVAVPQQTATPPAPPVNPAPQPDQKDGSKASAAAQGKAPSAEKAPTAKTTAAKVPAAAQAKLKSAQKAEKSPVKRGEEFWIQTGSFAAKARADAAKETLSAKGIASLVETKDVSGKTYFRVRVGPYTTKNEAEYWLSLVKTIDGFGASYVSQLKAVR